MSGDRVSSELDLHFHDGSIQEERTEFTQGKVFKLLSDHLRQEGPSFPDTVDRRIDASGAQVSIRGKDGRTKDTHLSMPDDVANGLLTTIIKDLPPGATTTVSYVVTALKPQVVKLEISPHGEDEFSAGGAAHKALHLVGHIHIGGVAGALASATGKHPEDFHYWIATGDAPTFLRFLGPLYAGGPLWSIELAAPRPEQKHASRQ